MLTTIHFNLPKSVGRTLIKSVIGSLNATAIAYARGHLRQQEFNPTADVIPTIDDWNDMHAAQDEQVENGEARERMGFTKDMPTAEIAVILMRVRGWLAHTLKEIANPESPQRDTPLGITETLEFQMNRAAGGNDEALKQLAEAVELDFDTLKAHDLMMFEDDKSDLIKRKGKILDLLLPIELGFDAGLYEREVIDHMFESLPAHVQYKLAGAVMRAYDKAIKREMMSLIRSKKLDAAGNIKMLRACKDDMKLWIKSFSAAKQRELNDYTDRGFTLPDLLDEVVTA